MSEEDRRNINQEDLKCFMALFECPSFSTTRVSVPSKETEALLEPMSAAFITGHTDPTNQCNPSGVGIMGRY